jgi:putative ABC transport system permease protein
VLKAYPNAELQDRTEFKEAQAAMINQLLNLIYVLLLLAVVIALIGIMNTLALSIYERTRELGLLRAVGMSRRQLRSTVRWESVIISLLGTLLGLVIGLFFGWAVVEALADQGITEFAPPGRQLLVVLIIGGFAGVLAAIPPARRAAKLDVLRAVTHE